jgi:hypothetical protein
VVLLRLLLRLAARPCTDVRRNIHEFHQEHWSANGQCITAILELRNSYNLAGSDCVTNAGRYPPQTRRWWDADASHSGATAQAERCSFAEERIQRFIGVIVKM